jgi:hypothetical protein
LASLPLKQSALSLLQGSPIPFCIIAIVAKSGTRTDGMRGITARQYEHMAVRLTEIEERLGGHDMEGLGVAGGGGVQ